MSSRIPLPRRSAAAVFFLVLGLVLGTAVWINGNHDYALIMGGCYIVAAAVAYVASGGSGDIATIMRADGDERQRTINHEATRFAAYAMFSFALVGTAVQTAMGTDPTPFASILTTGGAAYSIALGILHHRW